MNENEKLVRDAYAEEIRKYRESIAQLREVAPQSEDTAKAIAELEGYIAFSEARVEAAIAPFKNMHAGPLVLNSASSYKLGDFSQP